MKIRQFTVDLSIPQEKTISRFIGQGTEKEIRAFDKRLIKFIEEDKIWGITAKLN